MGSKLESSPGERFLRQAWPALALVVFALWTLRLPLAEFGSGLWGPENAWTNRDFLGAWWLFLAADGEGAPWAATAHALMNQG